MRCPDCGFTNSGTAKFCMECGTRLAEATPPPLSEQATIPGAAAPAPPAGGEISLQPTLGSQPTPAPTPAAANPAWLAGRYELLAEIGRGGMGVVHKAHDHKLGRPVALKRILASDDQGVARFLREAQAIAALNHQNIRAIYDRGEDEQGPYLAMEWVEGETLHDRVVRDGPLPTDTLLEIATGLARGLSYAHRRSVIHRDVKPANVLLGTDGTPKLTDFGLARMGHDSDLSVTGYGMGTLDYASPEQRRDAKSADHRSDIYGLGATLYFAATGESPKTIRETRISERWRAAVMKCLEERPENRYFAVDDLLRDLESLRTRPLTPPPIVVGDHFAAAEENETVDRLRERLARMTQARAAARRKRRRRLVALAGAIAAGGVLSWAALAWSREAREAREAHEAAAKLKTFGWEVVDPTPGPQTGAARKVKDPRTGIVFVLVEPGEFLMGSPASEAERGKDETQHRVTLTKAFYLGETEVTQAQWRRVMGANPSNFKGDMLPVEMVGWEDCLEFCRKAEAGYRLPTEAEWEYACRAGTSTPFSFGSTISTDQANFDGDYVYGNGRKGVYRQQTTPVGSFPANAWGFKDMHGNVLEWCQDRYGEYPSGSVVDPTGASSGWCVLRGGSLGTDPGCCRSAYRLGLDPSGRYAVLGLRVARTL